MFFKASFFKITNFYGTICSFLSTSYFNNCNYNQAYEMISHLYSPEINIKEPAKNSATTGKVKKKPIVGIGRSVKLSVNSRNTNYVKVVLL